MGNDLPPMRAKGMVHKMIADVAKGCAGEQWETLAKQNAFFKVYPKRRRFVQANWDKYVPVARQMLTGMLGDPKRPTHEKDAILEALKLDGTVNPKEMAEPAKPVFTFSK